MVARTRAGSAPSSRNTSTASSYQVASPELVAWYTPAGGAARASATICSATSTAQVGCPSWSATTSTNGCPACQAGHRPDEIGPVCPVQPGGPHHVAGLGEQPEHGLLPGQLGAPVGGARRGAVILRVGSKAIPAEHVVGGHVHQPGAAGRARGGDVLRPPPVDQEGLVLAGLGIIDGGPGCAVDDDSGAGAPDEGRTAEESVTSRSPCCSPVTSWPRRPRTLTRSRPSIPPAPVTSHPVMARRGHRPRWPGTAGRARGATA